jgi:uncharacterized protein
MTHYLPCEPDLPGNDLEGLDAEFWAAAREGRIRIQRCNDCHRFQWGPEWICHHCYSESLGYGDVGLTAKIYSWERVWHASDSRMRTACPYLVLVVELDEAPGVRLFGNLLGDPRQEVVIGSPVVAEFEHHDGFSLIQWRATGGSSTACQA